VRRREDGTALVEQWPAWVCASLTYECLPASQPAYDYCAERGYNPMLVLWVKRAHKLALAGDSGCPCPMHMAPGEPFPSPDELERQWDRGRL
jgi:hypothetical protein